MRSTDYYLNGQFDWWDRAKVILGEKVLDACKTPGACEAERLALTILYDDLLVQALGNKNIFTIFELLSSSDNYMQAMEDGHELFMPANQLILQKYREVMRHFHNNHTYSYICFTSMMGSDFFLFVSPPSV